MADLTEQNIREIEVLVEARGVEMQELSYDLVDHICCMIEEKMESGINYASALEESIASFGKKGIRQIQEETTFLLTKNILAMRRTMHITGITAAILLLLGSIFKIQHWPGAAVMYILGAAALCFLFMPLFLTVRIKEKPGKLITISNIIGALGGAMLCIGILFKIMHWPFANILMNLGGFSLMLIFLPIYLYNGYKTKQLKTKTIAPVIIAIAGFSLMFSLVKLRNSNDVLVAQHNILYNLDNENVALDTYNKNLLNDVNIEQLAEKDKEYLKSTLEKTKDLTRYIDNLITTSFWSINQKGMTREDALATLDRNYAALGDAVMDLNLVRGQTAENENLESILLKVSEFENEMATAFGGSSNLIYNKLNFEAYIKKENNRFPVGIVLQDLTTLKLQVQNSQTIVLAYYQGKSSK
jgi:hypothetical protein